jgi:nucleoid-associated protein YgaU
MKKYLLFLIVFIVASGLALGAQSLVDNPSYQKSLELNAQAVQAYNDGDYDAAAEYASQAKDYAALSDQYVDKMVAKSKADKLIAQAKDKMDWADGMDAKTLYPEQYGRASDDYSASLASYKTEDYADSADKARLTVEAVDAIAVADADAAIAQAKGALSAAEAISAPTNYPSEYGQAKTDLTDAVAAYDAQDFITAAQKARACIAALAGVKAKEVIISWPAVYVVRLIPARRDCLWRIAEYPFIYNNPLKWPVIYNANKKTFRDPSNPNLIFPGQKLKIPSIKGETRDGTYDPTTKYEPFPKK